MRFQVGIVFLSIIVSTCIVFNQLDTDNDFKILLDNSGPYVGVTIPKELGYDGSGIVIGVIDTGVDHTHPDLFGFGTNGKIIGGYNYMKRGEEPLDSNGHGTQVAGIIAADGQLQGIAPGASIMIYKVSDDGESVASNLIIKAIDQAIKDEVDIINISLGVNKTNAQIDNAVTRATDEGIVVVTAAGNDGPALRSIGSPARNPNSITVGATYNNVTSSLVATLKIDEREFQVLPIVGIEKLDKPIEAEIVFGGYGRERDFLNGNFQNSIVLVERGSDVEGEIVYFSDKENNSANSGAKAVLIYNNEKGNFLGTLVNNFTGSNYEPRIPAVSMARDDGLAIKDLLENTTTGILNVFYDPDFVAFFSSRGPVSAFYNKPDLVAPGVFVNTTIPDGKYNFTSGTSMAAPHVTGAIAILMQKNPELGPPELKSLVVTTTDNVSDAYENEFSINIAGSGRLNVTRAFDANTIISPHNLIFNLSPEKLKETKSLSLKTITGDLVQLKIQIPGPDVLDFSFQQEDNVLYITSSLDEEVYGKFDARIFIQDDKTTYNVPILVQVTEGSIGITEKDGRLNFNISHPDDWSFAKISLINPITGKIETSTTTPSRNGTISVHENGLYWIEAKIKVNDETFNAYETVQVESVSIDRNLDIFQSISVPERQLVIIFGIISIVSLVGLKIRKESMKA